MKVGILPTMTFPEHYDGPTDDGVTPEGDFSLITQIGEVASPTFNPQNFNTYSVVMRDVRHVIDVLPVDRSGEPGK
jgi:hypothetical protein